MIGLLLFALAGCAGGSKQALPSVMAQTAPPTIDHSRVGPDQGPSVVAETTRYEVRSDLVCIAVNHHRIRGRVVLLLI